MYTFWDAGRAGAGAHSAVLNLDVLRSSAPAAPATSCRPVRVAQHLRHEFRRIEIVNQDKQLDLRARHSRDYLRRTRGLESCGEARLSGGYLFMLDGFRIEARESNNDEIVLLAEEGDIRITAKIPCALIVGSRRHRR